jgi:hypothetical protein
MFHYIPEFEKNLSKIVIFIMFSYCAKQPEQDEGYE